jgi:CHAD domain-containing protein
MDLNFGSIEKHVRTLLRSLKGLAGAPPIEDVHNLRTQARRVEAIAAALMPGDKKLRRRLMKTIRPVRKAAGEVRDMDVLAAKARSLARPRHGNSVARMLEYLRSMRVEGAHKLLDTVAGQRSDARRSLKRFSRQIERRFHGNKPRTAANAADCVTIGEAAKRLIDELNSWPAFTAENLHPFRIKVKELRYLLQLTKDGNPKLLDALGKVKDQIGDWHDWQQLAKIAAKVLNPQDDRAALKNIDKIGREKLDEALAAARTVKPRYLNPYAQARI